MTTQEPATPQAADAVQPLADAGRCDALRAELERQVDERLSAPGGVQAVLGQALASRMSALNGYPVTANIGYPTPGSFGSWAGIDQGIPVITLELPRELSGERAWETNRQALIASLRDE